MAGEVLCAVHGIKNVVAHAHDGEILIDMQMAVAPDAHVPAAAVARVAKHDGITLVGPLGRRLNVDIRPLVLKARCHHQRVRGERLC